MRHIRHIYEVASLPPCVSSLQQVCHPTHDCVMSFEGNFASEIKMAMMAGNTSFHRYKSDLFVLW